MEEKLFQRNLNCSLCFLVMFFCLPGSLGAKETITFAINSYAISAQESYFKIVHQFEKRYPGIKIDIISKKTPEHKGAIRRYIEENKILADVMIVHCGEQMESLARNGRLLKLTEHWNNQDLSTIFAKNSQHSVTINSEIYGLPFSYYPWGIFYKRALFEQYKLKEPKTFEELLHIIRTLGRHKVTPFSLSNDISWSYLAWFDYLNMRLNGLEFHEELLQGIVNFNDQRVTKVLLKWKDLIDAGAFCCTSSDGDWNESLPMLFRNITAMTLMGNFIMSRVPEELREDFGFFPFPQLDSQMPRYETVPFDAISVSHAADLNDNLKTFLNFLVERKTLQTMNQEVHRISPNIEDFAANDDVTRQSMKHINEAAGIFPYFDRATSHEFAIVAKKVFWAFINDPDNIVKYQQQLEDSRHLITQYSAMTEASKQVN